MLLTDKAELKAMLGIRPTNKREDVVLSLLITIASEWIQEFLGRELDYAVRTEYYAGTGTQQLNLRHRPVYATPTIACIVDLAGGYDQPSDSFDGTALEFGTDFLLDIEDSSNPSRSGILIRRNDFWPKPSQRQQGYLSPFLGQGFGNIKVTYGGGFRVDNLPAPIRGACDLLVMRLRTIIPIGAELSSESYEERNISYVNDAKAKLMALVRPMIWTYRNWTW